MSDEISKKSRKIEHGVVNVPNAKEDRVLDLTALRSVHFVGIGGIGISAVARMMLAEGKKVSGSDVSPSEIVDELGALGVHIAIGHSRKNVPSDADLMVYTTAVPVENPELAAARDLGILTISYPEMLHQISRGKYTIAISGTHGKTTTTAMTAELLIDADLDPTVIVGSLLKEQKSNFIAGKSRYFVVEACEYRRAFLQLQPRILVITNIDADHLDYYKSLEGVQKGFSELVAKLGKDDVLVCDPHGQNIAPVLKGAACKIIDYTTFFDAHLKLKVPGVHNKKNAAAVSAIASVLGISAEKAVRALERFPGTWRRFEFKGVTPAVNGANDMKKISLENESDNNGLAEGILVYDDYGHHPTEISATLAGARELYPNAKIAVIFQPHLYSRTKEHLADFGRAFKDADFVILPPIYAAREEMDATISSALVAREIVKNGGKAIAVEALNDALAAVPRSWKKGDVIIVMGAGDVYLLAEKAVQESGQRELKAHSQR